MVSKAEVERLIGIVEGLDSQIDHCALQQDGLMNCNHSRGYSSC